MSSFHGGIGNSSLLAPGQTRTLPASTPAGAASLPVCRKWPPRLDCQVSARIQLFCFSVGVQATAAVRQGIRFVSERLTSPLQLIDTSRGQEHGVPCPPWITTATQGEPTHLGRPGCGWDEPARGGPRLSPAPDQLEPGHYVTPDTTCSGNVQMQGLKRYLGLVSGYYILAHRIHLWDGSPCPHRLIFEEDWSSLGGVPLGMGFEVSKALAWPGLCLQPMDQDINSQLLLQRAPCLPGAMLPSLHDGLDL